MVQATKGKTWHAVSIIRTDDLRDYGFDDGVFSSASAGPQTNLLREAWRYLSIANVSRHMICVAARRQDNSDHVVFLGEAKLFSFNSAYQMLRHTVQVTRSD